MISPQRKATPPIKRCVAHISERGPVTVSGERGSWRLRDHAAFLEWLTSPSILRAASHVWLSPSSAGWDLLAGPLRRAGWDIRLSRRRGEYLGLYIAKAGKSFAEGEEEERGRSWFGGSCLDLVEVERDLSPEDETRAALEQLQALDRMVAAHWHGVRLDCSVASTAVRCFQRHLQTPVGLSRAVAAELLELDAYGGGHIERFCARGAVFEAAEGPAPHEVDLSSAYPTAMATVPIPGEFAGYGSESEALDPCTLSVALVTVPERLYPPLRYRIGKHLFYPWGTLLGTWSSLELRCAVAAGCRIERVVRTMKFEDRGAEFGSFADALLRFRREALDPRTRAFAKSLGVQFVGALGSRVKTYRVTTTPEKLSGCKLDRPGLYSEPVFEPSERQILSAALTITGAVAGWGGLLLRSCETERVPVYYIHTDGIGTVGDPSVALRALFALGAAVPELHIPIGQRDASTPGPEPWKVEALQSAQCWAPNRRIMVDARGVQRVAAGGISRTLTAEEIDAQMRADAPSEWTRTARRETGHWTEPFHVRDLEPDIARELESLLTDHSNPQGASISYESTS